MHFRPRDGQFIHGISRLFFTLCNRCFPILLITYPLYISISCSPQEGTRETTEQLIIDSRTQVLDNWLWETENNENISFDGQLLITALPKVNSGFSSNRMSQLGGNLPQAIRIQLPLQEQILGTVSVALEPTAEVSSLVLDAWLRTLNQWGGYDIFHDANPFSSAQLLFTTSTKQSDLLGQMTPRSFELYVSPSALPPYIFSNIQETNFNLNLPPVSNVEDLSIILWQNLDERIALNKAKVSLWHEQKLLTTVGTSDLKGELKLSYWQDAIDRSADESSTFQLLVNPSPESRLPTLRKTLSEEEINSGEVELAFPNLGSLIETSLSVELNGTSNAMSEESTIWTVWVKQIWLGQPDQDYSHPSRTVGHFGESTWFMSYPIIPNVSNEISVFDHVGTLFLNPPTDSSQRTQRIELSSSSDNETLRLSSLPKPLLRGVLRNQEGDTVEAKILMTQLAWPWREANDLPLNQFVTYSNSAGGFSIAVEPGVYALSYLPLLKEYAPKVILLKIPEAEGLLLSPQQSLIERGAMTDIRVAGEGEQVIQIESRLQLECLIPRNHPIFLGSSEYGNEQSYLKVNLYQDVLKQDEILNLRLSTNTCPNLPILIDSN